GAFGPAPDRARVRAELGLAGPSTLLLTVRDLQPRMGLDTLLRALAACRSARPLTCVIGGSGQLRPALEPLAAELGLAGVARLARRIPDELAPLYYRP